MPRRETATPSKPLGLSLLVLGLGLGLGALVDEGLVDVRDDAATSDGGLDEGVELLVATDGELKMARRDALHAEIARGVAGELKNLSVE
jgi:hypothetical protein